MLALRYVAIHVWKVYYWKTKAIPLVTQVCTEFTIQMVKSGRSSFHNSVVFLTSNFVGVNLAYACLKMSFWLQKVMNIPVSIANLAATKRLVNKLKFIGKKIASWLMEHNQSPKGCQLFMVRQLILSGCNSGSGKYFILWEAEVYVYVTAQDLGEWETFFWNWRLQDCFETIFWPTVIAEFAVLL